MFLWCVRYEAFHSPIFQLYCCYQFLKISLNCYSPWVEAKTFTLFLLIFWRGALVTLCLHNSIWLLKQGFFPQRGNFWGSSSSSALFQQHIEHHTCTNSNNKSAGKWSSIWLKNWVNAICLGIIILKWPISILSSIRNIDHTGFSKEYRLDSFQIFSTK